MQCQTLEMSMPEPTHLENYFFDLQGYVILRNAVSKKDVQILNETLDPYTSMKTGEAHKRN
jgi:hypothetical protein